MVKRINGIKKGKAGEREAANWLAKIFNLSEAPTRNLKQTREGGHDLNGFQPFCIEVKRQETLAKRDWWLQVTSSVTEEYNIPVVMYRQNRKKWKFLISAIYIGVDTGFIELEAREFELWANKIISGQ